ncbi:MAG: phage tail protein [Xanthomonadaceae bacterium]|nr:phage tail protein [Xanthomonadaceae bacterium]
MTTPYVGEIRLFAFPRIPSGWIACNGSLLPIAQYDVLYSLLGTTYGGDGTSTFAVPDLRGQLPVHMGAGPGLSPRVLGQAGGSENVTLMPANLPPHTHTWAATSADANANAPSAAVELGTVSGDTMYTTDVAGLQGFALNAASIANTGGSQPHENTMPTLAASFCIAWEGIYPSQG